MIVAYLRVSTEDQQDRGTIENQREFALKYCDLHQLGVPTFYADDGISGTIPLDERAAGKRLLSDAQVGLIDTLLVYKLDRLGRSARVTLNAVHAMEEKGVTIKSMTEPFDTHDASGRFLLTILAGVADLERSNILDRMWYGAQRAAKEGQWMGGIVPYGYHKVGKYIEIDEAEALVVQMMYQKVADDGWSCIKLSDYMNSLQIPTAYANGHGKRKKGIENVWRPSRVRNLLINTVYKGIHFYGKRTNRERELIPRAVPAIVTEEQWERAQKQIKKNHIFKKSTTSTVFLLKGLIKCGSCGLTYNGVTYKYGLRNFYRCNGKAKTRGNTYELCQSTPIPADWIESKIWNRILEFVNNPGEELEELRKNVTKQADRIASLEKEKAALRSAIDGKAKEREIIIGLARKSVISTDEATVQLEKLGFEKTAIQNQLADLAKRAKEESNAAVDFESIKRELTALKEMAHSATPEIKQKIIRQLVEKVVVFKTEEGADFKASYRFVASNHTDKSADSCYTVIEIGTIKKKKFGRRLIYGDCAV